MIIYKFKKDDKVRVKKRYWPLLQRKSMKISGALWLFKVTPKLKPEGIYTIDVADNDCLILKEDNYSFILKTEFFELIPKEKSVFGIVKFCQNYYK
jgi:hypothetical protein